MQTQVVLDTVLADPGSPQLLGTVRRSRAARTISMSFILDALKKSELERQRQAAPGLIEAPVAHRGAAAFRCGSGYWVRSLLVNLGVLSVMLLAQPALPHGG